MSEDNRELIIYCCIYVFSVLIASVSQIMLKISANKKYPSRIKEYLNPIVIIAYGLFFGCTFITMYALKVIPLTFAPILEASGYIFVAVLSYVILKEKISKRKLIGFILIVLGIAVYVL